MHRKCFEAHACIIAAAIFVLLFVSPATAVCPEEPALKNFTGGGSVVCPCFVTGERAGAVLQAPAEHYPIEITRVGIGWGSVYGGNPQSIESAIRIFAGGLPNPGTAIFTLDGPVLTDGAINEFNLDPLPGEIIVNSGPFTVVLQFLNSNAGNPYASSMVHDGNGCQPGKNVVYAIPGGWQDACALGVTGDWVVQAVYRRVNCGAGVEEYVTSNVAPVLLAPEPNPFSLDTRLELELAGHRDIDLSVYDTQGRLVTKLATGIYGPGSHTFTWQGCASDGSPVASGIYFAVLKSEEFQTTQRLVLAR